MPASVVVVCLSQYLYGAGTTSEHVKLVFAAAKQTKTWTQPDLLLSWVVDPLTAQRFHVNRTYTLSLTEEETD